MSKPETALMALNPQSLLAAAIDKGASIETMERLVALAKDMEAWTARRAFHEALAQFRLKCPAIKKDATARIATSGGGYSYSYATLPTILDAINPVLGELGLAVSWESKHDASGVAVSCLVSHRLGHREASGFVFMPYARDGGRMNPAQAVGSALTYARRYSLLAILGLAPEDDDDAQGTDQRADPPKSENDPRLVAESERLFPDPEKDALIQAIRMAFRKIPEKDRGSAMQTYLGGSSLEQADLSALSDLKGWCDARIRGQGARNDVR